jgi:hypothetical protein
MDRYIVVDLQGKENHINRKSHQFYNTLILNVNTKTNIDIVTNWTDSVFKSLDSFLSNSACIDLIIIDKGNVFGYKAVTPTNIVKDLNGDMNIRITYAKMLDNTHPYMKTFNRAKKISIIIE